MSTNIEVTRYKDEPFEAFLARFRKTVDKEGVLKDHKMNVLMTHRERKKFKAFAASRRSRKKEKRVSSAINHKG